MEAVMRVVLIEDDAALNEALVLLLELGGYVVSAYLSITAFKQANDGTPAMFLIDRYLGREDGLNLCRELKANAHTRQQPVIMMSANLEGRADAEAAGADAFLSKPFNKGQLQNLLKELFRTINR